MKLFSVNGFKIIGNQMRNSKKNILALLILIYLVVLIACSSLESKLLKGVIVEPITQTTVKPQGESGRNIERKLSLEMWQSFEYQMLNNKIAYNIQTRKEEFCVLSGTGVEIPLGASVEILEEARCLWVLHQVDGQSYRYNISMSKIRFIETGQEGWTWSKAVSISE